MYCAPFALPVSIGVSRKRYLSALTSTPTDERLAATLAANLAALARGAAIFASMTSRNMSRPSKSGPKLPSLNSTSLRSPKSDLLPWRRVGLGLGADLGDPAANLRRAVALLREAGLEIEAVSSLYRTKPWRVTDQPFRRRLRPCAQRARTVGAARSRSATERRSAAARPALGPRPIDIDLLFIEDMRWRDRRLTLPHEGLMQRAFVLLPLAEIAPDVVVDGARLTEAAGVVDRSGVVRWAHFEVATALTLNLTLRHEHDAKDTRLIISSHYAAYLR